MFIKKKVNKTIPDNKYRVIKISKDAIFEFIYESIIDKQEIFFNITDKTSIVTMFDVDWDKGELICVARNEHTENEHLHFDNVDTKKLLSVLKDTTSTMYSDNRYVELSEAELTELQSKGESS